MQVSVFIFFVTVWNRATLAFLLSFRLLIYRTVIVRCSSAIARGKNIGVLIHKNRFSLRSSAEVTFIVDLYLHLLINLRRPVRSLLVLSVISYTALCLSSFIQKAVLRRVYICFLPSLLRFGLSCKFIIGTVDASLEVVHSVRESLVFNPKFLN